jgi:hypothetical protein
VCIYYAISLISSYNKKQWSVEQIEKKNILCSATFSRKSCLLWDNEEWYGRFRRVTWRMRIARWITKATHTHTLSLTHAHTHTYTHSQYATFIALPLQQWLHQQTPMLRYTYTGCLVLLGQYLLSIYKLSLSQTLYQLLFSTNCPLGNSYNIKLYLNDSGICICLSHMRSDMPNFKWS